MSDAEIDDFAEKYMILCQLFEQFRIDPTVPPAPDQLVPLTSPQARAYANAVLDVLGVPFPGGSS